MRFRFFQKGFLVLFWLIWFFFGNMTYAHGANKSLFISQQVPTQMTTGKQYKVSLWFLNSGKKTWKKTKGYKLGSQSPQGNKIWGTHRVKLSKGEKVKKGSFKKFTFTVTAPSQPGNYNFQWQMVQEKVEWFGSKSTLLTIKVKQAGNSSGNGAKNDGEFISQNVPNVMFTGQSYSVSLTYKNTGKSRWKRKKLYKLGSQSPQDNMNWGTRRAYLPKKAKVKPGQQHTFTFQVTAPSQPGLYAFQWRPVQDKVGWFGEKSQKILVQVNTPPASLNEAKFVSQNIPATMKAGKKYKVHLRFKNKGNSIWSRANKFKLGSLSPMNNKKWGKKRVRFSPKVKVTPNQIHRFSFTVTAPAQAGKYDFQWQMVHKGTKWFGQSSTNVRVTVIKKKKNNGGGGGNTGGGNGKDAIDPSKITWLHADVSNWAITSKITKVNVDPGKICIYHTKAGKWPVFANGKVEGNPWVVAKINGKWYAGTYEWLRPGQTCKALGSNPPAKTTADLIGPHVKKSPLDTWKPKKGELVGFLVSTRARDNGRTSNERSNIVLVKWGQGMVNSGGNGGGNSHGPKPGQIVVDSQNPAWLKYHQAGPYFMCGPGDPEGFLYRGTQNADGTRSGDQVKLINKLAGTGANCIYLMALRSHGGDGDPSHNPFVNNDPSLGLNQKVLDQWEKWFTKMDKKGITIYFFFYDDSARVWNTGDNVSKAEKDFFEALVNKFEHHKNLIWCVGEEYAEKYSAKRISKLAAIIRNADDYNHPIAIHKNNGLNFQDFANDPNIDQFAIQYNVNSPSQLHSGMKQAFKDANGRYNLNMSEAAGFGTGVGARKKMWATAMGGAYVMILGMDIASTPKKDLIACGNLVRFFEKTNFNEMSPRDDLAFGGTEYVLAKQGQSYIAYASSLTGKIGLKGIKAGDYDFYWYDISSGKFYIDSKVSLSSGDQTWKKPGGVGKEVALYLQRSTVGTGGNKLPQAQGQNITLQQGGTKTIHLGYTDADGPGPHTFTITSQPKNGTLTGGGSTWTYLANSNYTGNDSFTFTVNDGIDDSSPATVNITVKGNGSGPNQAPKVADQFVVTKPGKRIPITLNYSDPDGPGPYSVTIVKGPQNGNLKGSGNDRKYRPKKGFLGVDKFTWKVDDGQDTSQIVTVRVAVGVYPRAGWKKKTPGQVGMSQSKLDALRNYVGGRGVVIRHGYQVYSWGNQSQRADVGSAVKPVYTYFVARAIEQGKIKGWSEKLSQWEPGLKNLNPSLGNKDGQINWHHVSNQISGYGVTEKPGQAFDYNDYNMALLFDTLMLDVYQTSHQKVDNDVLRPLLTDLLNCQDKPTFMAFGTNNRAGRMAISVRDFARFGLLFLRKGEWQGQQLLSQEMTEKLTTSSLSNSIPRTSGIDANMLSNQRSIGGGKNQGDHLGSYSYAWWTNGIDRNGKRHWAGVPNDVYGCFGHGGQKVMIVIPSHDLIISWNDSKVDTRAEETKALQMLIGAVK